MIDKNKLLAKYADNLVKSENRNHYLGYARDFLDNAEGLDRASIDHYIAGLQERYKPRHGKLRLPGDTEIICGQ